MLEISDMETSLTALECLGFVAWHLVAWLLMRASHDCLRGLWM